ncbi:ribonuclease HI family protein [Massilia cavernae]|uniref:Reverse transcriptase-like protein n=1 Tax=Massilia cavernae TaxID=2320864 RepID=A0A418Y151_9BURK|nr:ribonuclease HI family protein [Massilia cavernae]RJG19198.1 reverse transcriptase-like protein [Massilia cavernae]
MYYFSELQAAAYKTERSAARRLSASAGIPEEQALRRTLELSAGTAGLASLLATRAALRDADAVRQQARAHRAATASARTERKGEPAAWRAWFDGSAHPNPGRCGIGGLLLGPGDARIEISRAAGHGNSSEAEYLALIAVLEAAVETGAHGLAVYGDSQVVVDDMHAHPSEAAGALAEYRATAQALLARLDGVTLRWIPRHRNGLADALSQRACVPTAAET